MLFKWIHKLDTPITESVMHMTSSSLKSLGSQSLATRQDQHSRSGRFPRSHRDRHSSNQPRPRVLLHSLQNWLRGHQHRRRRCLLAQLRGRILIPRQQVALHSLLF